LPSALPESVEVDAGWEKRKETSYAENCMLIKNNN